MRKLDEFYSIIFHIKNIIETADSVVEKLNDNRDLSPESRKKGTEYLKQLSLDLRVKAEIADALLEGNERNE